MRLRPAHYPLIVAVHAGWLAALWLLAPGQPVSRVLLAIFLLLQLGRLWVLHTLAERWTTRIIILPNGPLVTGGPFRFVRHPNYLVVVLEIAVLPACLRAVAGCADLLAAERRQRSQFASVRRKERSHRGRRPA
jgi:methyltransferase